MITMTQEAARQLKRDLTNRSLPEDTVLRVDVEKKTEQALELVLKLDKAEPAPSDIVETTEGARLAVDKELAQHLGNAQLDFRDGNYVFEQV